MGKGDAFLKVQGAKTGLIKGDAQDPGHREEIDVMAWSWGMKSTRAMGAAGPASRAAIENLIVYKTLDKASTALMTVMHTNELLKSVVLTVRKAGGDALEYMHINLSDAFVVSYALSNVGAADAPPTEVIALSFARVEVEYTPQGADGLARGGTSFLAETASPSA